MGDASGRVLWESAANLNLQSYVNSCVARNPSLSSEAVGLGVLSKDFARICIFWSFFSFLVFFLVDGVSTELYNRCVPLQSVHLGEASRLTKESGSVFIRRDSRQSLDPKPLDDTDNGHWLPPLRREH